MIKFSFEVPIEYLEKFDEVNDYQFILAHLLTDKRYYDFYKNSTKYKILDNGANELGKSINVINLINYGRELKVNALVAPDVICDKDATIKLWKDFKKTYKNLPFKIMVVPQGKTPEEYKECLEYFIKEERVDILGLGYGNISKAFKDVVGDKRGNDVTATRLYVANELVKNRKPTHLLGMGHSFNGGVEVIHNKVSESMDTATPIILAIEGERINSDGTFKRSIKHLDFNYPFDENVLKIAIRNAIRLKSFGRRELDEDDKEII